MRQGYSLSFLLIGIFAFLILLNSDVAAEEEFKPVFKPELRISRTSGEISIDGRLDDTGWSGTASIDHFHENSPGDQIKPPVKTKAYLTYDNDNLYVGIVCYDNPNDIRASWCERDQIYSDDNVGFFFCTYEDATWGYTLNVNPYGLQADALWTNGYGEDSKYDLVWESAGQITDSGYQVELAIPFSSLRFPKKEQQVWKVEFWRHHQRDSHHQISWAAYDRDESCWACQWGTVTGIEDVIPGRGIEIMPSMIGYQSGSLTGEGETESPFEFDNEKAKGEISLNTKYSVSSDFTIEATINPDFSQVEADADQIDVNTTTALSFPEKRPFFLEGSDLFRSFFNIVYTRSINDPYAGIKATARWGRFNFAYLGAYDENTPLFLPFEERSTGILPVGKSFSNIFRFRQSIGTNSRVGAIITDRRYDEGGSNSVLSTDGSIRLSKFFQLGWQVNGTHSSESNDSMTTFGYNDYLFDGKHTAGFDGESFWGYAAATDLEFDARNVYADLFYYEKSRTYRADNGFQPTNNLRYVSSMWLYVLRFDEGPIETVEPYVFFGKMWNFDGLPREEWVEFNLSNQNRIAQTAIHVQYMIRSERYAGINFEDIWGWHVCLHTQPSYLLAGGVSYNYGHRIAYGPEVMGKQTAVSGWIDLRPLDRVYWENWIDYITSKSIEDNTQTGVITGERLYEGYITRSRLSVQFNRELSLRFVVQYNDFYNTWDFDPLVTYRISPFTMFYVGSTYDYRRLYGLNEDESVIASLGEPSHDCTRLCSRQFFMKLQYLFQL